MGRYSNPDNVARLQRVLAGQGGDRVSHRPVPSLRQKRVRLTDSQRSELVKRYIAGESSNALAAESRIDRRTATAIIKRAGARTRYRVDLTGAEIDAARELYQAGRSLATGDGHMLRDLDAQLRAERGPNGEACVHDFPVFELLRIVEWFATGFDELPELISAARSIES